MGLEGEPGVRAEGIDVYVGVQCAVFLGIGQHVEEGVAALGGCLNGLSVVAVGEDLAPAVPLAIEVAGQRGLETVHGTGEGGLGFGFAEEVDVIALDGELDDAEALLLGVFAQEVHQECNELRRA